MYNITVSLILHTKKKNVEFISHFGHHLITGQTSNYMLLWILFEVLEFQLAVWQNRQPIPINPPVIFIILISPPGRKKPFSFMKNQYKLLNNL